MFLGYIENMVVFRVLQRGSSDEIDEDAIARAALIDTIATIVFLVVRHKAYNS